MLAAGLGTAVLAGLSLTTVQLQSVGAVLALTLAVVVAAGLVARRCGGRGRRLAVSGALLAALLLLLVAARLSTSDG